ncbi:recombinase family protein [Nitrospirales bacterium NOB]|nr:recombinase family protein [Nitrospirales bacterium NOB]
MKAKRVALYQRVSTADQNVEMQDSDLHRYCEQRGLEVFKVYVDKGISGAKDRRPALDQLMSDAKKRRFDVVLVWRFDRFARSTRHLITALEEFRHCGIDFISFQENIDTSSPMGKAMFTVVAAVAELERSLIAERVKAGLRNAKSKGRQIGRKFVEQTAPETVARVLELRKSGMGMCRIADEVGLSSRTVWRLLQRAALGRAA